MNAAQKQYLLITGNYWAFTLTDGALRMLVVLYFHQLGYAPLQIALLFLFYEFFGVVTNLLGGWLGARIGLNRTMHIGLLLQVVALSMLLVPSAWLTVPWVMAAQALSGIAKDLNKMSAKSAIKTLLTNEAQTRLFHWVAVLTGSKNALKGIGFFLGGLLLSVLGFQGAIAAMAIILALVGVFSLLTLKQELGKAKNKPKFSALMSSSRAVNILSAARLFLFAARDVWFVIALPVFLAEQLQWSHTAVGSLLALWIIGYGAVQALAPRLFGLRGPHPPGRHAAILGALILALIMLLLSWLLPSSFGGISVEQVLVAGLLVFGVVFAINSALHSYLIVAYAREDGVSLDVGFYYMANAMGRLAGTVLSGYLYQQYGLMACLLAAASMLLLTTVISLALPRNPVGS
ncbi:organoarsenical effux MFS transporter ArsJ [Permianibacter aggregans]|uniref:MFS transporter n=1 Tax=Permianibacter aggregans TaxID=1510150 RepID=A0A4R6UE39_9GAMM|nr:organoarsenical effux MFS transporter ArsJ [Permianibacter aggregans]QGX40693.1 organoarsenical effux MFS transporter ArsJ [Permianibacter aggregans]TDQ43389.1 MFS transporter [Permianibacter aggregans]